MMGFGFFCGVCVCVWWAIRLNQPINGMVGFGEQSMEWWDFVFFLVVRV